MNVDLDRDVAVPMHLAHDAGERGDRRLDRRHDAEHVGLRGDLRAVQMVLDLAAHDLRLLGHLCASGPLAFSVSFCRTASGVFKRVREIADMRARALHDLAVGIDERVQVRDQRLDLARIVAFEVRGCRLRGSCEGRRAPGGAGAGPSASEARCRRRGARPARRASGSRNS